MPTAANMGRWKAYLGSTGSPSTYTTAIEEVFEISGVGQTNDLLDVTNFDSATGTREFIGGLADGQEVSIRANFLPAGAQQILMVAAVVTKANRNFRVSYVGVSPNKTWTFVGSPLSWVLEPAVDDKNVIAFTVKISGAITAA